MLLRFAILLQAGRNHASKSAGLSSLSRFSEPLPKTLESFDARVDNHRDELVLEEEINA
jgi:hypothetical protein